MSWTIHFTGISGKSYKYWSVDISRLYLLLDQTGNYGFLKPTGGNNYTPLYFGKADSLRDRHKNHERWREAVALGATVIVAHTTPAGVQACLAEERDLIAKWNPPMNVHHRTVA
jgi:hypothetical protein